MVSHPDPFLVGQRPRLEQDGIGYTYFTNVVKERSLLQSQQVPIAQADLLAYSQAKGDNSVRMSSCFNVTGFENSGERAECGPVVCIQRLKHVVQAVIQGPKLGCPDPYGLFQ